MFSVLPKFGIVHYLMLTVIAHLGELCSQMLISNKISTFFLNVMIILMSSHVSSP